MVSELSTIAAKFRNRGTIYGLSSFVLLFFHHRIDLAIGSFLLGKRTLPLPMCSTPTVEASLRYLSFCRCRIVLTSRVSHAWIDHHWFRTRNYRFSHSVELVYCETKLLL